MVQKLFFGADDKKAESIESVVITTQISTHIVTIAFVPAPTQIIISGPRAILGRLFKTTIYGSKTFLNFSLHHKSIAIKVPRRVAIKNPKIVSYKVIHI